MGRKGRKMKKSLFALALAACFAFGASELETLEEECNDGNMESCYKAGLLCEDNATSFKLFEKACNGGCEEGCLSVSEIIMQEDSKKGIRYLEKNCNAKCTICCGLLGIKYSLGVDVEKDKKFGIFTRTPEREEVVIPVEERFIVELYSK